MFFKPRALVQHYLFSSILKCCNTIKWVNNDFIEEEKPLEHQIYSGNTAKRPCLLLFAMLFSNPMPNSAYFAKESALVPILTGISHERGKKESVLCRKPSSLGILETFGHNPLLLWLVQLYEQIHRHQWRCQHLTEFHCRFHQNKERTLSLLLFENMKSRFGICFPYMGEVINFS